MSARARRRLDAAVLVDPWGSGDKDGNAEYDDHVAFLTALLKPARVTFARLRYMAPDVSADLLLFDYGGMTLGNDLLQSNSRALVRWVQDHPSALVLVASRFTWMHGIRWELVDAGLLDQAAENFWGDGPPAPPGTPNLKTFNYFMDLPLQNEVRTWFGLPRLRRAVG